MRNRIVLFLLFLLAANASFAAITGVVMTTDGAPVAGAKVSIFSVEAPEARRLRFLTGTPDPAPLASATTDAKGAFTLESPKDAIVDLDIDAKGFEPATRRVERDDEAGAIALRKADMKTGTITAGGKPVAGAKVMWMYGGADYVATTDAEGRYSAPDPKMAGRVVIFHKDYALVEDTQLNRNLPSMSLDRTLVSGMNFTGRVVAADGQTPVAKAEITVDGWPLATTTDDGSFTIAHLAPKWQQIIAKSGSQIGFRTNTSNSKTIRLGKAATLSGVVRDAKTQLPIAGAAVNVSPSTGRFEIGSSGLAMLTDAKGVYSFSLPPGSYRVMVSHPSYDLATVNASVGAGQNTSKSVSVAQLARISGNVTDEDKVPVAAAIVSTEAVNQSDEFPMGPRMMFRAGETVRSGPDGRFTVRIPESEVRVVAVKKGWPTGKSDGVKVAAGERKRGVSVTVPRGFPIGGRITDRNDKPLSGVSVSMSESVQGGSMMGVTRIMIGGPRADEENLVKTGSDGTFALRLKEGTYDFTFRREGLGTKIVRNIKVGPGAQSIEASLDPSVDVTGRVVRNGVGVEGVNIFAFMANATTTITGPDGSFTLSDLTPGPVRIEINKGEDFIRETRNVTAPARDLLIELPPGGRISGRVVDKSTRQPLTNFQAGITASRSGGGMMMMSAPQMKAFTSDDGSFVLENVGAGAVTVVASAPGYTQGRVPGLTVEDGKSIDDVVVELDTGSKLVGRITGPNGEPLANATIRQSISGGAGRLAMLTGTEAAATTEANGEYVIEALEPGEKSFEISHADFLSARKTVEVSGRETRLDVQLSTGQRVSGVVVTEAGVPVVDAAIRASSAGGSGATARSGAGGAFTFEKLSPGRYTFSASKAGLADGIVRDFDIAGGGQVRISMSSGAILTGRVTGLADADFASTIVEARGGTTGASSPVDPQGNYRIEGAPTGTVRVTARVMRGITGSRSTSPKTVELTAGDTRTLDLEFRNDTTITGRVTRNGQPLVNANVTFFPKNAGPVQGRTSASSPTDERGAYSIAGLEDGEYNVQVLDLQRFNPFTTQFEVRGSGTFDIDVKGGGLRGRVVDSETGQAVADVAIQLRPATTETFLGQRMVVTDTNGLFSLDTVAPGRYTATAEKQGYGNQTLDVQVTESGAPDLEFKIARNDGVLLRVVDARDGRLLGAIATVMDMQGRIVSEEFMRFGGSSAEELKLSLAPGSYRAVIGATGYAAQTINITSPGRQTLALTPGGTLAIRSKTASPRRMRIMSANGQPYLRPGMRLPYWTVDVGTTTIQNIAPGTYTLQFLGANDAVEDSVQATVVEGQTMTVDA